MSKITISSIALNHKTMTKENIISLKNPDDRYEWNKVVEHNLAI